ncbi:hypothetical protein SeLEV6574_g07547 [Synchytrium endobioticum]|nr:hypothetical protein SeLEV6574_g07547 [Synchytrium endobioticum]
MMTTDLLPTQLAANDDTLDTCINEKSHFEDHNVFIRGLEVLKLSLDQPDNAASHAHASAYAHAHELNQMLATLIHILEKYQEQPHLLDPHLQEITLPTVLHLRLYISNPPINPTRTICIHRLFKLLYSLTKVRGYKTIIKFFSHDVSDLEPALAYLQTLDSKEPGIWETRYVLLLWLSLISMIPFDLKNVDSGGLPGTLMDQLIKTGEAYLGSTGKEYEGAAVLLTRLLTRRDIAGSSLNEFVHWSMNLLQSSNDAFLLRGVLRCLAMILKAAPRALTLPLIPTLLPTISLMSDSRISNNALLRKLAVKMIQRMALALLKPRVASWRYHRGTRSLSQNLNVQPHAVTSEKSANGHDESVEDDTPDTIEELIELLLNGLRDRDTVVRWSAAKGLGRLSERLPQDFAQQVISFVLSLFTQDTFIIPETLEVSLAAVSDATWHGACLAIAELARRGLLLPERLHEIVPWITKAIVFDQRRGAHSIGAHVRDAACYVCWSFARAYSPETMKPYVPVLAKVLVVESVYDREINIRRASSAAFQENVGRQGIFPHGIDIVMMADYFAVGNRGHSYLEISAEIAKFDQYRRPLMDHLVNVSTQHWDRSIRELASATLYKLTKLDLVYALACLPTLISRTTAADVHIRHGAILAVGKVCLAWFESRGPATMPCYTNQEYQELIKPISCIIPTYPTEYLESFGSDLTRAALCQFVSCLADARWPRDVAVLKTWWEPKTRSSYSLPYAMWCIVNSTLERREDGLQEAAARAVTSLASWDALEDESVATNLMSQYLANLHINVNAVSRRGFALGVGALPAEFLLQQPSRIPQVIKALISASLVNVDKAKNDAEARRNAVAALANVVEKLALSTIITKAIDNTSFDRILRCFLQGLSDYTVDARGDVGSWVREASLKALTVCLPIGARVDGIETQVSFISKDVARAAVAGACQQALERIDRVREAAGALLMTILWAVDRGIAVESREEFEKVLPRDVDLNWLNAGEVYPRLIQLLHVPEYRVEILVGIAVGVGGLAESLIRQSTTNLVELVNSLPANSPHQLDLVDFFRALLDIFARYRKQDRIILPLFEILDVLFVVGVVAKLDHTTEILDELWDATRREVKGSRDAKKLLAAIKLFGGFASLGDATALSFKKVGRLGLELLLAFLTHAYPKVRRAASEQAYVVLSTMVDLGEEAKEEVETALLCTDWDQPVPSLRPAREKIFSALNMS